MAACVNFRGGLSTLKNSSQNKKQCLIHSATIFVVGLVLFSTSQSLMGEGLNQESESRVDLNLQKREKGQLMMQTEANKKLILDIYSRLTEGDGSMFVEHLAEDAVFIMQGNSSWSGKRQGKENILRFFREVVGERAPGVNRMIPKQVFGDDKYVIMEATGEMTSKDGKAYKNDYCLLFRIENNLIVEMKEYLDTAYLEDILGPLPVDPARD